MTNLHLHFHGVKGRARTPEPKRTEGTSLVFSDRDDVISSVNQSKSEGKGDVYSRERENRQDQTRFNLVNESTLSSIH